MRGWIDRIRNVRRRSVRCWDLRVRFIRLGNPPIWDMPLWDTLRWDARAGDMRLRGRHLVGPRLLNVRRWNERLVRPPRQRSRTVRSRPPRVQWIRIRREHAISVYRVRGRRWERHSHPGDVALLIISQMRHQAIRINGLASDPPKLWITLSTSFLQLHERGGFPGNLHDCKKFRRNLTLLIYYANFS